MNLPEDHDRLTGDYSGKPSIPMQDIIDQMVRDNPDASDPTLLPPEEGREVALLASLVWNTNLPQMARVDSFTLSGSAGNSLRVRLYTPHDHHEGLIFFVHGGGFAFGDIDSHDRCCRCLASETGCSLLSINYRLAPEYPYPAGLEDCIALFRQLGRVRNLFPWTRGLTAVAGDSAGANLALALTIHEEQASRAVPDFGLLFYGVYGTDLNTHHKTTIQNPVRHEMLVLHG